MHYPPAFHFRFLNPHLAAHALVLRFRFRLKVRFMLRLHDSSLRIGERRGRASAVKPSEFRHFYCAIVRWFPSEKLCC